MASLKLNIFIKMNSVLKNRGLIWVVIIVHISFFLLESLFWMRPDVHEILIQLLNNPVTSDYGLQALTLKNLFINQGFYNLFLSGAGLMGLKLVRENRRESGLVLLLFLCAAATGAGLVLAFSTRAYILAAVQALPAAFCFLKLLPDFREALRQK